MSDINRRTAPPRSTPRAFARAGSVLLVVSTVTYYWVKNRIDEHRLEFTRPENRNTRVLTWEERAALDAQEARKELEQVRKTPAAPPSSPAPPPPSSFATSTPPPTGPPA